MSHKGLSKAIARSAEAAAYVYRSPDVPSDCEYFPRPDRRAVLQALPEVNLANVIAGIQYWGRSKTHDGRTRKIVDTDERVVIVSGYQPGEGEDLHGHPTKNTLVFLDGEFTAAVVNADGQEQEMIMRPGDTIYLNREQPHRVQASAALGKLSIVQVTIEQGMDTHEDGYSFPVQQQPALIQPEQPTIA